MVRLYAAPLPPVGLGIASFVLGFVGLLMFFLPVLAVPISFVGVVVGTVGLFATRRRALSGFRWSIAGSVLSLFALVIGVAIAWAPSGFSQSRPPMPLWQPVPNRPYVPPPARPLVGTADHWHVEHKVLLPRSRLEITANCRRTIPGRQIKMALEPPASKPSCGVTAIILRPLRESPPAEGSVQASSQWSVAWPEAWLEA